MSHPGENEQHEALWDRLRQAVKHLEGAVRCYAALFARRTEAWTRRVLRAVLWAVVFVVLAVTGVVFILSGAATLLDSAICVPGLGQVIVGGGLILILLVLLVVKRRRGGGGSDG